MKQVWRVYAWLDKNGENRYETGPFTHKGQEVEIEEPLCLCADGLAESTTPLDAWQHGTGQPYLTMLEIPTTKVTYSFYHAKKATVLHTPVDATNVVNDFMIELARQVASHYSEHYTNPVHLSKVQQSLEVLNQFAELIARPGISRGSVEVVEMADKALRVYQSTPDYSQVEKVCQTLYYACSSVYELYSAASAWKRYYRKFTEETKTDDFWWGGWAEQTLKDRVNALFID